MFYEGPHSQNVLHYWVLLRANQLKAITDKLRATLLLVPVQPSDVLVTGTIQGVPCVLLARWGLVCVGVLRGKGEGQVLA